MDIKRNRNIIISVAVHAVIFYWLGTTVMVPAKVEVTQKIKAIKSYIYRPVVKKKVSPQKSPTKSTITKPTVVKEIINKSNSNNSVVDESLLKPSKTERAETDKSKSQEKVTATKAGSYQNKNVAKKTTVIKPATTLSPQGMIGNLRQRINKNIIQREVEQQQQFSSASGMHKAQTSVPKSVIKLTPEQKKEQNTTRLSSSMSITKLGNGTCMIERGKQLGIDIPASVSMFSCGESDFDKSFRLHMKKVRQKLAPIKNVN